MKNRPGSKRGCREQRSPIVETWRICPAVIRWCHGLQQVTGLTQTETAARLDLLLDFCVRHDVAPQTIADACCSGPDTMAQRALYLKAAREDGTANLVVQSFLVHNGINIFGDLVCLPRGSQQVVAEQGAQWDNGPKGANG